MSKNTICIWYDKDAEAAARFYAETFPDSYVSAIHKATSGLIQTFASLSQQALKQMLESKDR